MADGFKKLGFFLVFAIILIACGEENPKNPNAKTGSVNFSVIGSNGASIISANTNDGVFSVAWSVNSSELYHVDLYIAASSQLDKRTDVHFASFDCGLGLSCGEAVTATCSFNGTSYLMVCGNSGTSGNLTDFLTNAGFPTKADSTYLSIEVCNWARSSCVIKSAGVSLTP